MDLDKEVISKEKYKLPNHWMRTPWQRQGVPYFGYIEVILKELPQTPSRILDAGCGDGRISAEMVQRKHQVIGLDYLPLPVTYAQNMVPQGTFFVGDLREELSKQHQDMSQPFDVVTMVEVYEHIPPADCSTVLKNIYDVLKSNGTLIISVPSHLLPQSRLHYRHFHEHEICNELTQTGYKIKKVIYQHLLTPLNKFLLSEQFEKILSNNWLQPIFLQRLRWYLYKNYTNVSLKNTPCGRYIVIGQK